RFPTGAEEFLEPGGIARAQGSTNRPMIEVEHEYAHRHFQLLQGLADALLLIGRTVHHPVVFDRPETLCMRETDLIGEGGTGKIAEQAVMDAIVEMERCAIGGCRGDRTADQRRRDHSCARQNGPGKKLFSLHSYKCRK